MARDIKTILLTEAALSRLVVQHQDFSYAYEATFDMTEADGVDATFLSRHWRASDFRYLRNAEVTLVDLIASGQGLTGAPERAYAWLMNFSPSLPISDYRLPGLGHSSGPILAPSRCLGLANYWKSHGIPTDLRETCGDSHDSFVRSTERGYGFASLDDLLGFMDVFQRRASDAYVAGRYLWIVAF